MKIQLILFFVAIATALSSCYYDKEDLLYGGTCDTTQVNYSVTITGILNNNGCLSCHAGNGASGGVRLDNYSYVKSFAHNGRLYGAISHAPGYVPMPDGAGMISSCDIKKVKAWINAGTPDN